jgi:hypothetical protein
MTDTPEKIWAGGREPEWFFDDPSDHRDGGYKEYTRTDIAQAEYKKGFEDGCAHIIEDYKAGQLSNHIEDQVRIAELEVVLFRSKVAWENALEIELISDTHERTVKEIITLMSATLKGKL